MQYYDFYDSPHGQMLLVANDDEAAASARWSRCLAGMVRQVFELAVTALPRKGEGRHLGHARARNLLESALRKQFPSLVDVPKHQGDPG